MGKPEIVKLTKAEWNDAIKNVPPAALVFVWGSSWVARGISWYQGWASKTNDKLPTHTEMYFGSGAHMSVSAEATGVKKTCLDQYISTPIDILTMPAMTIEQMMLIKGCALGNVNKPYDFMGLIHFLGKLIKKDLPEWKFAAFCSELSSSCYLEAGIQLIPNIAPGEQTPGAQWLCLKANPQWKRVFSNIKNLDVIA